MSVGQLLFGQAGQDTRQSKQTWIRGKPIHCIPGSMVPGWVPHIWSGGITATRVDVPCLGPYLPGPWSNQFASKFAETVLTPTKFQKSTGQVHISFFDATFKI
ncbi:hypothetical protein AAC387_Pa07g0336 [Persea americana]